MLLNKHLIALIFVFIKISAVFSNTYPTDKNIEKLWLGLLHIKNNKNTIQDNKFYLSNTHTTQDEFDETLKQFKKNPKLVCKFPARYEFLKKYYNLSIKQKCPDLEQHILKILQDGNNVKLSLVFATENITSPVSMMGHLLLKISSYNKKHQQQVENTITYLALHEQDKSLYKFYFDSLFSGSFGVFILKPYKDTIILYNNTEDRNLEEYDLELSQEQVYNFVLHLWELKDIEIPYNFITNNCGTASIDILASIDTRFYDFYTILKTPIDTLKLLFSMELINNIFIYHSIGYKIKTLQDNFTFAEKQKLKNYEYNEGSNKDNMLYMMDILATNDLINKNIDINKYK